MNAGKYNKKIQIVQVTQGKDSDGFPVKAETVLLEPYAEVKTTRGYTLIASGSDFEKAYTNFTIRYSATVEQKWDSENRNLRIKYKGKTYSVDYLNNIDEANVELELQAKRATK